MAAVKNMVPLVGRRHRSLLLTAVTDVKDRAPRTRLSSLPLSAPLESPLLCRLSSLVLPLPMLLLMLQLPKLPLSLDQRSVVFRAGRTPFVRPAERPS